MPLSVTSTDTMHQKHCHNFCTENMQSGCNQPSVTKSIPAARTAQEFPPPTLQERTPGHINLNHVGKITSPLQGKQRNNNEFEMTEQQFKENQQNGCHFSPDTTYIITGGLSYDFSKNNETTSQPGKELVLPTKMIINGHFILLGTSIKKLPDTLHIHGGGFYLSDNKHLEQAPRELVIERGSIHIENSPKLAEFHAVTVREQNEENNRDCWIMNMLKLQKLSLNSLDNVTLAILPELELLSLSMRPQGNLSITGLNKLKALPDGLLQLNSFYATGPCEIESLANIRVRNGVSLIKMEKLRNLPDLSNRSTVKGILRIEECPVIIIPDSLKTVDGKLSYKNNNVQSDGHLSGLEVTGKLY